MSAAQFQDRQLTAAPRIFSSKVSSGLKVCILVHPFSIHLYSWSERWQGLSTCKWVCNRKTSVMNEMNHATPMNILGWLWGPLFHGTFIPCPQGARSKPNENPAAPQDVVAVSVSRSKRMYVVAKFQNGFSKQGARICKMFLRGLILERDISLQIIANLRYCPSVFSWVVHTPWKCIKKWSQSTQSMGVKHSPQPLAWKLEINNDKHKECGWHRSLLVCNALETSVFWRPVSAIQNAKTACIRSSAITWR